MDPQNPAINPPYLPSPIKRSLHSRSPSRSPVRRHHSARDLDPILRDLSPTATLRAFSSGDDNDAKDHLSRSVETTSQAQRKLGIKAAQSCLDLRSWTREIEIWEWPGTFDVPEPARKKQRTSGLSLLSYTSRPSMAHGEEEVEPEYWGSLPAQTVQAYQRRVDEISEDLDELDVSELKDFVLSAHSQAGNREASVDDSIGAIGADVNLKRLDDFTALVTATILQSLPYLSRLHRLLETWNLRLRVLRSTPTYLHDLTQARTDLDHGWAALVVSNHPAAADAMQRSNTSFSRDTMLEMKMVVQKQVISLGSRLDGFLNMLEGREECVPDAWIEDFEVLEEQYGEWVVQAERKVLDGEWRAIPVDAGPPYAGAGADRAVDATPVAPRNAEREATPTTRTVTTGPTTTTSSTMIGAGALSASTHTTSSGPQSTTVTTIIPHGSTQTRTSVGETITTSNRSSTIPVGSSANSSPQKHRSRHVPIVIDGYSDEFARAASGEPLLELPATTSREISPVPGSTIRRTASNAESSGQNVKKRAAFLNGDIEKSDGLNRSKPAPIVRPFEHASNAFTRLFKRDKDEEKDGTGSRSSSVGSRGKGSKGKDARTPPLPGSSSQSRMGYADLVTMPTSRASDETTGTARSIESRSRSQKKLDPRVTEYVDLARVPPRTSSEHARRKSRPNTPKESMPSPFEGATRARSSSNRSKRSSKQNITALPTTDFEDLPVPTVIEEQGGPETYLPTGLSSPFHSPVEPEYGLDIPENWPLSGDVTPAAETEDPLMQPASTSRDVPETEMSDEPLATDAFESLFVSSIESPPRRPVTSGINAANELETRFGDVERPRTAPHGGDRFYLEKPPPDWSLLRTGRSVENLRIEDFADQSLPRPVSMVMEADEEEFDRGGNAAAYFGSIGRTTASASSSKRLPSGLQMSKATPPVSPMVLKLKIPQSGSPSDSGPSETEQEEGTGLIRRASARSIDSYPRSSLKRISLVRGSGTDYSPRSLPQTPLESIPNSAEQGRLSMDPFTPTSPLHYKDDVYFPSPPSVPPRDSSLRSSPELRRSGEGRRSTDLNDLSTAMADSKRKTAVGKHVKRGTANSVSENSPLKPGEDNFDRHVSEVLDRVHASNIKFKTRPGAETPLPTSRLGGKLPKAAERSGKNMTLAPAEISPKKSTPADPEVKLYHLTQAGRSEPIKLYVRLVGEGERVMVRVGGGWADLADYLRQYAEHHGSRTVSESVLELQTVSNSATPASANGLSKRTFSGPAASESKAVPQRGTPVTPASAQLPLSRQDTNDSERQWLGLEQPRFTMGDSDDSSSPSPVVAHHAPTSRPSTARSIDQSIYGSSSLRQAPSPDNSPGVNLSMAGPGSSSKAKADLPEQKARWVEGMIERVNKSASAEKSRGERFTDIGKAGGTRRLAFRKSSAGAGG